MRCAAGQLALSILANQHYRVLLARAPEATAALGTLLRAFLSRSIHRAWLLRRLYRRLRGRQTTEVEARPSAATPQLRDRLDMTLRGRFDGLGCRRSHWQARLMMKMTTTALLRRSGHGQGKQTNDGKNAHWVLHVIFGDHCHLILPRKANCGVLKATAWQLGDAKVPCQ